MTRFQEKNRTTFARVATFVLKHPQLLAPKSGVLEGSIGQKLGTEIVEIDTALHETLAVQSAGAPRSENAAKAQLREHLNMQMYLTATAVAYLADGRKDPAIVPAFKKGSIKSDSQLLARAEGYAAAIEKYGLDDELQAMNVESAEALRERIAAYRAVAQTQSGSLHERIQSTSRAEVLVRRGRVVMKGLDAIIRSALLDDPELMAVWDKASHLARRKRSKPKPDPAAPTTADPAAPSTTEPAAAATPAIPVAAKTAVVDTAPVPVSALNAGPDSSPVASTNGRASHAPALTTD